MAQQKGIHIDKSYLDRGIVSEFESHKFTAEASTLGLKPGEWPTLMSTTLGNRHNLLREHFEVRDGDLLWVRYVQVYGCVTLKIFND